MRQIEIGEFVPNDDIDYEVGADNYVVIEDAEPSSKSR